MMDWNDLKTWSVLLVDDEPDNAEITAVALRFFGATVKTAANGAEGLEVLKNFLPNLILLDLSMPVMDGWEMRKRVKSNPDTRHILVVALSAHAMAGDKERVLEAGFDGYLSKPINIPTFIKDLRAALDEQTLPDNHLTELNPKKDEKKSVDPIPPVFSQPEVGQ